eukprot:CAMPEP_0171185408 /NCGR_PEP_ID=MMETSP0790-20130122/16286_1 /TAXON_ID=2925 /ORGANISM="Alexandrium catenella, Strain OF101" /LENGTH=235 /DNA_ID=CAMNT_0011650429 /DNA_START=78 /DNA_END=783 /DNA_ORIENTATION=+
MPATPRISTPSAMRADTLVGVDKGRPAPAKAGVEAVSREAFQNFCRTRHFALPESDYWRQNGPPKSKADAYFPRFAGGRNVNAVANNSERMRFILQPDPWSAATGASTRQARKEGLGQLFAVHTSSSHAAQMVWPGAVKTPHSEGQEDDVSLHATPRRLAKREIAYEAAKALPQRAASSSLTARARFGRGAMLGAFEDEGRMLGGASAAASTRADAARVRACAHALKWFLCSRSA